MSHGLALVAATFALAACGGGGGTELEQGPAAEGFAFTAGSDVREGEAIDPYYTCDGEDVAPQLAWEGAPEGTKQLALVLEDPDAPGGTFTHLLAFAIEPSSDGFPSGVGLRVGKNDFDDIGYGGPCPPEGEEHRYVFRLLALHAAIALESGADRSEFDAAAGPHVLAEARLTATYRRG